MALLMGRSHRVIGGMALACPDGRLIVRHTLSHVQMRRLDSAEMEAYIAQGDWEGKAGGYAIQGPLPALSGKLEAPIRKLWALISISQPSYCVAPVIIVVK